MRNPTRWRNLGLGLALAGLAAGAALTQPALGEGLRVGLMFFAWIAVLVGGGWAWERHRDVQAADALERGDDVLARWHVSAADWREFVGRERRAEGPPHNELTVGDEIPPGGVDVIVGRSALLVDGSIHRLPRRGTPEITDAKSYEGTGVIDLQLYYPGSFSPTTAIRAVRTRLRFPFPPEARLAAREVAAHYGGELPGEPDFFHGRGDGSDPEDLSKCWSCGFETYAYRSHCPQCGSALQSRRWARRFGVFLMLAGAFITVVMYLLIGNLSPMLLQPGRRIGNTTFNGTPAQATAILALFGAVLAFGATTLCYGFFQVTTGKRSLAVVSVLAAIFLGLVLLAHFL
jgi:hypothetical protein